MKSILNIVLALSFVSVLAACGPVYKTDYRFSTPPTAEGKVCANACLDKRTACVATCKKEVSECKRIKALEGENAYLKYVNEKKDAGEKVEKDQSDFTSYSSCNTKCADQCDYTHRICHSNCGGDVIEHRYCTAFCD